MTNTKQVKDSDVRHKQELREKIMSAIVNDPCIHIGTYYSDGTPIDEESAVDTIEKLLSDTVKSEVNKVLDDTKDAAEDILFGCTGFLEDRFDKTICLYCGMSKGHDSHGKSRLISAIEQVRKKINDE